jgi:DNA gyrase subunit A
MTHVKGPDFPTGCTVCGLEVIKQYLRTGRGEVKVRGRVGVEQLKGGREQIVVTEIPYGVNRATLVERIAELVNEKTAGLTEITAIRDESDENTRVVIELKRDAVPKVVINNLYKFTQLETSFAVNMLAIDHGRPKTLGLKELINCYIEHRREVVLRRTRFELKKAEERAEVLEGYLVALANLDDFIHIIRSSRNRDEAKIKLLAFEFSRAQAEAFGILIRNEARLQRAVCVVRSAGGRDSGVAALPVDRLEIAKVDGEYRQLLERIADLLDILAKESRVLALIKSELRAIQEKYATARRRTWCRTRARSRSRT